MRTRLSTACVCLAVACALATLVFVDAAWREPSVICQCPGFETAVFCASDRNAAWVALSSGVSALLFTVAAWALGRARPGNG